MPDSSNNDNGFFQNNSHPPTEPTESEVFSHVLREETAELRIMDGGIIEIPQSRHESQPNEDGTYTVRKRHIHHVDRDGTPINIPEDSQVAISYTGLTITDPRLLAHCNRCSRIVKLYSDGIQQADGTALCNRCITFIDITRWILMALGTLLLIGVIKGLGWF